MRMKRDRKIWFDVILRPHRSLSPRGFLVFMTFVVAISFVAGFVFYLRGAWPIFGFFGLDAAAIYWAFKANYRAAEVVETIRLTNQDLAVCRMTRKGGDMEWHFQPYWVRVIVEPVNEFEGNMVLTSHGRRVTVGSFLSLEEKVDLAAALQEALALQRAGLASGD
jgi:uncharacterized membrane protein